MATGNYFYFFTFLSKIKFKGGIIMEITLSAPVVEKLQPFVAESAKLLLDLDDGVGEFSKFGICSLDTSFRLLVVKEDSNLKDYNLVLKSLVGPIYIKDYTAHYFGEKPILALNPRFSNLVLTNEAGLLDGNVEVIDMRGMQDLSAEDA